MKRSNIAKNVPPHLQQAKNTEEILIAGDVPEHIRQLLIDNKRMSKRIQVLETEIEEKNRMISQLKNHLDEGVIESTQQKLAYYRSMEEQVQKQVRQAKERLVEQSLQLQEQQKQSDIEMQAIKQSLNSEIEKNSFLLQKIQSLKQYIIDIIDEKDYLIAELGTIISEQEKNVCKDCTNLKRNRDAGIDVQPKKKAAFIKKNQ